MKKDSIRKSKRKGFTLVEVIIVLAIIAIIAAIAIPNLTKVRTESKIKADIQSVETLERTVNMLVTDESIPFDGATPMTVTLTYSTNKSKPVTGVTSGADSTANAEVVEKIEDYFKDVKSPQQEGRTAYEIKIDDKGEITGKTTPEPEPEPEPEIPTL